MASPVVHGDQHCPARVLGQRRLPQPRRRRTALAGGAPGIGRRRGAAPATLRRRHGGQLHRHVRGVAPAAARLLPHPERAGSASVRGGQLPRLRGAVLLCRPGHGDRLRRADRTPGGGVRGRHGRLRGGRAAAAGAVARGRPAGGAGHPRAAAAAAGAAARTGRRAARRRRHARRRSARRALAAPDGGAVGGSARRRHRPGAPRDGAAARTLQVPRARAALSRHPANFPPRHDPRPHRRGSRADHPLRARPQPRRRQRGAGAARAGTRRRRGAVPGG